MIGFARQEQHYHEGNGKGKHDVSDESQLAPAVFLGQLLFCFIRQQVENHRCPTSISAPASAEEQRAENLGDEIMERGSCEDARRDVEPESLNLHVFLANQAEEYQHIRTYQELSQFTPVFPASRHQRPSDTEGDADIGEIQQEKQVAC